MTNVFLIRRGINSIRVPTEMELEICVHMCVCYGSTAGSEAVWGGGGSFECLQHVRKTQKGIGAAEISEKCCCTLQSFAHKSALSLTQHIDAPVKDGPSDLVRRSLPCCLATSPTVEARRTHCLFYLTDSMNSKSEPIQKKTPAMKRHHNSRPTVSLQRWEIPPSWMITSLYTTDGVVRNHHSSLHMPA